MKNQPQSIPHFNLSPLAKAGVLVRRIEHRDDHRERATASPHRDTHYLLVLATQGQYTVNLDFEPLTFVAPALLVVLPGQVHHLIGMASQQGWGISVAAALLDGETRLLLEKVFIRPRVADVSSDFYPRAVALVELMENLQSGTTNPHTHKAVHALLNALLSLMAGQFTTGATGVKPTENRGGLIEQAFMDLLKQYYQTWKQPAHYAAQLAISVSHLNDTVKAITGRSVSAHIQQRSMLEAKRLLYFTDLSIKEIGYQVGYDDPVYFSKLFKKVTDSTPRHFQQQFRDQA